MKIVDRGSGVPVVLVPGIQGRWEWMAPAVDALAARCRVITFSLADEPSAEWPARGTGFDAYVEQIGQALDALHLERAVICGVSYGGLVAAAFLRRYPERVAGLVLVSAIPPSWAPDARARFFMRWPRLLLPVFLLSSLRLHREIAAASAGWWPGRRRVAAAGSARAHAFSGARTGWRAGLRSPSAPPWTGSRDPGPDAGRHGRGRPRPRGADGAHGRVHAHLAARAGRDAGTHRPPRPGHPARGLCRSGRAVCRSVRAGWRFEAGLKTRGHVPERRVG